MIGKQPYEEVRIYSSDLGRAVNTAQIIHAQLGDGDYVMKQSAGLRERYLGEIEGLNEAELKAQKPELLAAFKKRDYKNAPGNMGESDVMVRTRVGAATKGTFL